MKFCNRKRKRSILSLCSSIILLHQYTSLNSTKVDHYLLVQCIKKRKFKTVKANNFTNINKKNNYLKSLTILKTITHAVRNPVQISSLNSIVSSLYRLFVFSLKYFFIFTFFSWIIWTVCINKNVDIKFNAHDTFLEKPSAGTFKIEILESRII